MEHDFFILVSESENQYGHNTSVYDTAYSHKKEAQKELAESYETFIKDCDKGLVGDFEEYDTRLTEMKDFHKWRVTSSRYPQFFEEMRIEQVTVTI
jgi:hypothetical protein